MPRPNVGLAQFAHLCGELVAHERAVGANPSHAQNGLDYGGYGRSFPLPDQRRSHVYAHAQDKGTIFFDFFGEKVEEGPYRLTRLGWLSLIPAEGRIEFSAQDFMKDPKVRESQDNSFPRIDALAEPLGAWVLSGAKAHLDRMETIRHAEIARGRWIKGLDAYLSNPVEDDARVLAKSCDMVVEILAASRRIQASLEPSTHLPSAEDMATLDRFLHEPGGTTLFKKREESPFAAAYAAGPLLVASSM